MQTLILGLVVSVLVAGCAGIGIGNGETPPPTPPGTPVAPAPDEYPDSGPVPDPMFRAMVDDAAASASVNPSAVTVIIAEPVTWRDGSTGCPEPGRMYTQALVPGYRVVLEAGGNQYLYHSDTRGDFLLCPPERAQDPLEDDRT
jgi:hypothetical protein